MRAGLRISLVDERNLISLFSIEASRKFANAAKQRYSSRKSMRFAATKKRILLFCTQLPDSLILIFFACVSALFQLFQIGQRDFWYDEAYTGNLIHLPWKEIFSAIAYDVHPPLYYILLKAYTGVMGEGMTALRSFSAIWGTASVLLVYAICKQLFSKKAALYAALLATILPFTLQFAQEARMYSLYAFLILLTFYCFIQSIKTERLIYTIGWGMSFGLACLTHYMAFFWLPCFGLLEMLLQGISWKGVKRLTIGCAVALLVFLPWLHDFLVQTASHRDRWATPRPTLFSDIFLTLEIFLIGMPKGELSAGTFASNTLRGFTDMTTFLWIQGIFISLTSYIVILKERKKGMVLVIFSVGFLLLTHLLKFKYPDKTFLFPRYVIPAAYFLCILIAAWLSHLRRYGVAIFFCVYLTLLFLIQPLANSQGYNAFQKELAKYDGYHFYSLNTFDYMIAKYYLGGPERLTLYNSSWPQFDSRPWPMIGYQTKRTEQLDDIKKDPKGIIIRNVQFPLELRDDKNFDPTPFQLIAKYKNIELYKYRQ